MKVSFTLIFTTLLFGCAQPLPSPNETTSDIDPAIQTQDDPTETSEATEEDATEATFETTICGCDDTLNLEESTVVSCLQDQLSTCNKASGGYWTDFGTNFIYIRGGQDNPAQCHFEIYIEEEGFRQKFDCQLEPGQQLSEAKLTDPYWPTNPVDATCVFIESCDGFDPNCEELGPSCLSPY